MAKYKKKTKCADFELLEKELKEKRDRIAQNSKWKAPSPEWTKFVVDFFVKMLHECDHLDPKFRKRVLEKVRENAHLFYDDGCPFPRLKTARHFDYNPAKLRRKGLAQPISLSPFGQKCLDFLLGEEIRLGKFVKWDGDEATRPIMTSPAFLAPRKGSVIGRIVIDYRAANEVLLPVPLPSPDATAIYEQLKGHKMYFCSDLSLAYNLGIAEWPLPKSKDDLVSFVALVRYLNLFTTEIQNVAAPLKQYELGKVGMQKFLEDEAAVAAFENLKTVVTSKAVLVAPDYDAAASLERPFEVFTDASLHRYAWAICQRNKEGQLRIWKCSSHSFDSTQQKWSTLERELFAIVDFIKVGYPFIQGRRWLLYSDHKNLGVRELGAIVSSRTTSAKILRWFHSIAHPLATAIRVYLRGESNVLADVLSRMQPEEAEVVDELAYSLPRLENLANFAFTRPDELDRMIAERKRLHRAEPFAVAPHPSEDPDDSAAPAVSGYGDELPLNATGPAPGGVGREQYCYWQEPGAGTKNFLGATPAATLSWLGNVSSEQASAVLDLGASVDSDGVRLFLPGDAEGHPGPKQAPVATATPPNGSVEPVLLVNAGEEGGVGLEDPEELGLLEEGSLVFGTVIVYVPGEKKALAQKLVPDEGDPRFFFPRSRKEKAETAAQAATRALIAEVTDPDSLVAQLPSAPQKVFKFSKGPAKGTHYVFLVRAATSVAHAWNAEPLQGLAEQFAGEKGMIETETILASWVNAPPHARNFYLFRRPPLKKCRAVGSTELFRVSAAWDPRQHCVEGEVFCPAYEEKRNAEVGRSRATLCECQCGNCLDSYPDATKAHQEAFLREPHSATRVQRIAYEGAGNWQDRAKAFWSHLPIDYTQSTSTLHAAETDGEESRLVPMPDTPGQCQRLVLAREGNSALFGAWTQFGSKLEGNEFRLEKGWSLEEFNFEVDQDDDLCATLDILAAAKRKGSLKTDQRADENLLPVIEYLEKKDCLPAWEQRVGHG
eukprot:g16545.t1